MQLNELKLVTGIYALHFSYKNNRLALCSFGNCVRLSSRSEFLKIPKDICDNCKLKLGPDLYNKFLKNKDIFLLTQKLRGEYK